MKQLLMFSKFLVSFIIVFLIHLNARSQISCLPNKFYCIGNSSSGGAAVYPLTISGSTISVSTSSAITGSAGGSLAIANLYGSGNEFYTSEYNPIRIVKYNGTSWQTVWTDTTTNTIPLSNAAGNGNFLYFHTGRGFGWPNRISRFDGTNVNVIWEDTSSYSTFADIAVDNNGNIYFFTGHGAPLFDVTHLNVMSPTGIILATIPLSITIDAIWSYGCFFHNNILYAVFGSSNLNFPNSIVPITITPSIATFGTPIPMPVTTIGTGPNGPIYLAYSDAASCGSAVINFESTYLSESFLNEFNISPNPTEDEFTVTFPLFDEVKLSIKDAVGKAIISNIVIENGTTLSLNNYPPGMYFIEMETQNMKRVKKLLKI